MLPGTFFDDFLTSVTINFRDNLCTLWYFFQREVLHRNIHILISLKTSNGYYKETILNRGAEINDKHNILQSNVYRIS